VRQQVRKAPRSRKGPNAKPQEYQTHGPGTSDNKPFPIERARISRHCLRLPMRLQAGKPARAIACRLSARQAATPATQPECSRATCCPGKASDRSGPGQTIAAPAPTSRRRSAHKDLCHHHGTNRRALRKPAAGACGIKDPEHGQTSLPAPVAHSRTKKHEAARRTLPQRRQFIQTEERHFLDHQAPPQAKPFGSCDPERSGGGSHPVSHGTAARQSNPTVD